MRLETRFVKSKVITNRSVSHTVRYPQSTNTRATHMSLHEFDQRSRHERAVSVVTQVRAGWRRFLEVDKGQCTSTSLQWWTASHQAPWVLEWNVDGTDGGLLTTESVEVTQRGSLQLNAIGACK